MGNDQIAMGGICTGMREICLLWRVNCGFPGCLWSLEYQVSPRQMHPVENLQMRVTTKARQSLTIGFENLDATNRAI